MGEQFFTLWEAYEIPAVVDSFWQWWNICETLGYGRYM